jgi:hypothetical protein
MRNTIVSHKDIEMAMRSSHSKREEEDEDIQPEKHWTKPSKYLR